MRSARISGWGIGLPEKVVTNDDLAMTLDTSDEWIRERSGIRERRIGGSTAGLGADAGAAAIEKAGLQPSDIGLLVLATTTPDETIPASSASIQHRLGLTCGAFDINAACSGFVYSYVVAHQMVMGGVDRVLLIGSETLSRVIDWEDRNTAVLFADGAAAVVLEATEADTSHLLAWDLGCDGSLKPLLEAEVGGFLRMQGREVFRQAVRVVIRSAQTTMERAGVTADDIALVVPHQANTRIIESANAKLGFSMDRTAMVLETTGNTSSASIPLALIDAVDHGRLSPGDLVLLVGFGAGMTSASAIVRWDP